MVAKTEPSRQIEVAYQGDLTRDQADELARCATSFRRFLGHWRFTNRETGKIETLGEALWQGQDELVDVMEREPWLFALKAGKLGFTELESAYDAWVARFRQRNARVHLFSLNGPASKSLLEYVRFGLKHLPDWMQLPILEAEAGGETTKSLKLQGGPDDVRTIYSYAAGPNVSIDQTATHTHVDELARMLFPETTWTAIQTTVAPEGSCHIITRGAGSANYTAVIWDKTQRGQSRLYPFFSPWSARAKRSDDWYQQEKGEHSEVGLRHFAPRTWQEALSGGEGLRFKFDSGAHVLTPFEIPKEWTRVSGTDYGFTETKVSPWYTGFLAKSPNGSIYLYREAYGAGLSAAEQGARVAYWSAEPKVHAHYAGPDVFQQRRGDAKGTPYTPAKDYQEHGIKLEKASNDRLAGAALFDKLLAHKSVDGQVIDPPRFYVFSTCQEFLRTFPGLLIDKHRPEDVDTDGEDDPYDAVRYGLMGLLSRSWGAPPKNAVAYKGHEWQEVRA